MKNRFYSIAALLIFCPSALIAGTDCRVVELPDRYEAICVGDERFPSSKPPQSSSSLAAETTVAAGSAAPAAQGSAGRSSAVSPAADNSSEAGKRDPKKLSPAVAQLVAFRNNKLQRKDLEAKKAIRMQNIIAGRKNEVVVPQDDDPMQN